MLVSPVSIHKGDLGSIIVGGREFNRLKPEESMKRLVDICACTCTMHINGPHCAWYLSIFIVS